MLDWAGGQRTYGIKILKGAKPADLPLPPLGKRLRRRFMSPTLQGGTSNATSALFDKRDPRRLRPP